LKKEKKDCGEEKAAKDRRILELEQALASSRGQATQHSQEIIDNSGMQDRIIAELQNKLRELEQDAYWAKLELARQKAKDLAARKLGQIKLLIGFEYIPNENGNGVILKTVRKGCPASQAGLMVGDNILSIDERPVKSKEEFRKTLRHYKPGEALSFQVKRGLEVQTIVVQAGYAGVSDTTVNRLKRIMMGAASDEEILDFVADTKLYRTGNDRSATPTMPSPTHTDDSKSAGNDSPRSTNSSTSRY